MNCIRSYFSSSHLIYSSLFRYSSESRIEGWVSVCGSVLVGRIDVEDIIGSSACAPLSKQREVPPVPEGKGSLTTLTGGCPLLSWDSRARRSIRSPARVSPRTWVYWTGLAAPQEPSLPARSELPLAAIRSNRPGIAKIAKKIWGQRPPVLIRS